MAEESADVVSYVIWRTLLQTIFEEYACVGMRCAAKSAVLLINRDTCTSTEANTKTMPPLCAAKSALVWMNVATCTTTKANTNTVPPLLFSTVRMHDFFNRV